MTRELSTPSLRNNPVDVVIPTYNSNNRGFRKVLESLGRELPLHHLIIVDAFSTDGTAETVRKIYPGAIIVKTESRLGRALKEGFDRIDTEFFVSLDDDDELASGFYDAVTKCLEYPNVGAAYVRIRTGLPPGIYEAVHLHRDGSIRTAAVRDWNPSEELSSGCDEDLGKHLMKKGYRILMTPEKKITPHGPDLKFPFEIARWYFKKGLWAGAGERGGKIGLGQIIRDGAIQFAANLLGRKMGEYFDLLDSSAYSIGCVIGYATWRRYLHWSRPRSSTIHP